MWYVILNAVMSAPLAAPQADPFAPKCLVKATAIVVRHPYNDQKWQQITFEIVHVYSGERTFVGRRFQVECSSVDDGFGLSPDTVIAPPIRKGEVGIWWLEPSKANTSFAPVIVHRGLDPATSMTGYRVAFPVPARRIVGRQHGVNYREATRWAEVVEEVSASAPQRRVELLQRHCLSENPYVAAWAVRLFESYRPAGALVFLRGLVSNSRLSVSGQTAADEALCRIDKNGWIGSKTRLALLKRWAGAEAVTFQDAMAIVSRVRQALHDDELDWQTWLPLMKKWITTEHIDGLVEDYLFSCYDPSGKTAVVSKKAIYDYSIKLLKGNTNPQITLFAAKWIARIAPLNENTIAEVEALQAQSKDEKIKRLLGGALEQTKLHLDTIRRAAGGKRG